MGGLISLMAVLKQQESSLFDGVVLMGPLIQIAPESASSFQKMLAKIASKVWPGLKVGSLDASNVTSDQVRGGEMGGSTMLQFTIKYSRKWSTR